MLKKSEVREFLSNIKTYRKSILIIFESLWLLLLWVISPFVTARLALAISPIAAIVASLVIVPNVSQIGSFLKEKDLLDQKMVGLFLYGTSYLLTLYLTIELLQKFVEAYNIDKIEYLEFALQTVPFLIYIGVFWILRNPEQLQYWAYALAYGGFIVWEWAANWKVGENLIGGIDTKFTSDFFITPYKEAMLLFIILDTFLKARDELKQEKERSVKGKTHVRANRHKTKSRK
ncbi:MAG: hypothetical protein K2O11_11495 [Oscillospiraceae bacterium]|nr:hypothetical protein [Oscillospiraceae bacterium]